MKTKTALLAAFLLTACAIGRAEVFEQILVKVNGEIFTKSDLEQRQIGVLRRNLEKTVIIQRVQQNEVMGKIGVTEDEARSYYDAHLSEFTSAPSVTLREILVSVPTDPKGVNAAADEAAQAKAAELRKRVTTGGDSFEKLASEVSESPSKANSGLIGPLNVGDISPDLRKIIDAMKPGDVTDVIRTNRGYQILKLETKTQAETMPFAQAHEQIGERVFT